MRFTKYLEESHPFYAEVELPLSRDHLKETLAQIAADAKPFLQKNHRPFFRGMTSDSGPTYAVKFPAPVGRRSLGSSANKTKLYNMLAKEAFGIDDWRGRSFFMTQSLSDARSYGNPHLIFPCGDYEGLFSPEVNDIYNDFDCSVHDAAINNLDLSHAQARADIDKIVAGVQPWLDGTPERSAKVWAALVAAFKDIYTSTDKFDMGEWGAVEIAVWKSNGYWAIPTEFVLKAENRQALIDIGVDYTGTVQDIIDYLKGLVK